MSFWILATAIPVISALVLFWPLIRRASPTLGLGLAMVVLVPVISLLMYQSVGTPQGVRLDPPPDSALQEMEMDQLLTQLQERMEAEPDNLDGWMLLGRSYKQVQRFNDAARALQRAREIAPNDPTVAVELAEALLFLSGPEGPDAQVETLLEQALITDPSSQKGLWLSGMVAAQSGNDEVAVDRWQQLLALLEPGSSVAQSVQQQLDLARSRLGLETAAAWEGITIRVTAPETMPSLSPASALFVIARDPDAPNPPLGAARIAPAFPAELRLTDENSMMPQRPISGSAQIQLQVRLSLSGDPTPGEDDPQSVPVTVDRDTNDVVELQLTVPN